MRDLRQDPRYAMLRRQTPEDAELRRGESQQALLVLRELAEGLAAGRVDAYETATMMWRQAMNGCVGGHPEDTQCHALWLLWGALTDWVELKPVERPVAEDAMRRAAREWLAVAQEDEQASRVYFDRWLYEEMGYRRPDGDAR